MKLYVCSSWRNEHYNDVLETLRGFGTHKVWDWRNPPTGDPLKSWKQAGFENHQKHMRYSVPEVVDALNSQPAQRAFANNLAGMYWCDAGVLLLPCECSSHLEAGWLAAQGKKVYVLAFEPIEPDLMVLALRGGLFDTLSALLEALVTP